MSLELNGVDPQMAAALVQRTKVEGPLSLTQTFADTGKGYIYTIRS